ncbi:MAG: CoA-binding protein, partial [Candidatus Nitrosotenuis sp.]
MERDPHTDDQIRSILSLKKVAVVGMSKNEGKAANYVPKYLISQGYDIVPINPTTDCILDRKCHANLSEITEPIDIIDVFRPSDQILPVVQEAIKI